MVKREISPRLNEEKTNSGGITSNFLTTNKVWSFTGENAGLRSLIA